MAKQERLTLVLDAGVDALVAAHYLARAGRRVLVLDGRAASDDVGAGWIPPRIVRDLALDRQGLRKTPLETAVVRQRACRALAAGIDCSVTDRESRSRPALIAVLSRGRRKQ